MAAAQFLATKQRLMEAPSGDKTQRGSEGILAKTSSRLKPGVSLPQQPPILPQNGGSGTRTRTPLFAKAQLRSSSVLVASPTSQGASMARRRILLSCWYSPAMSC